MDEPASLTQVPNCVDRQRLESAATTDDRQLFKAGQFVFLMNASTETLPRCRVTTLAIGFA